MTVPFILWQWPLGRRVVSAILRPFGWTITRQFIGRWSVDGDQLVRRKMPHGWRFAPLANLQEGSTALDQMRARKG